MMDRRDIEKLEKLTLLASEALLLENPKSTLAILDEIGSMLRSLRTMTHDTKRGALICLTAWELD